MNKEAILFHLGEAKEELDRTIQELQNDPDYCEEEFRVAMGHLYHHLNTAWNGRNESRERHRDCAQEDFDAWRKFPTNQELMLD
jgi:hypothetical protein